MPALSLLRFWREGAIALLLIACAIQQLRVRSLRSDLEQSRHETRDERAAHRLTVGSYRAAAEAARKADAENKARVERDQDKISQEVSSDYQERIADLRKRYDALRVRLGKTAADPGTTGTAPMPRLPVTAGGIDGAAGQDRLPAEDALIASEIALRLQALQEWLKEQEGIRR